MDCQIGNQKFPTTSWDSYQKGHFGFHSLDCRLWTLPVDLLYCSEPVSNKAFMEMVINLDNWFNVDLFYKSVPLLDPELRFLSHFDRALHALENKSGLALIHTAMATE